MTKQKELENIISSFQKWCLRKNMIASKNQKMPIIFVSDTAHCSYMEFNIRRSNEKFQLNIKISGHYCSGTYESLAIGYREIKLNEDYINTTKLRIKDFICQYIRTKNEVTTYKFNQINKACIDLIDNENIFLNKEENIKIKSIISKTEVIDYDNKTYKIKDLFERYL